MQRLPYFKVEVEHPNTGDRHKFYARADEPELPLATVMNLITFDSEQGGDFDANFISVLNEQK